MVWVGLFLLLASVAVVSSRDLWLSRLGDLLGAGGGNVPQAEVLWKAELPPSPLVALADDFALVAGPSTTGGDAAGGFGPTGSRLAFTTRGGPPETVLAVTGTPLTLELRAQARETTPGAAGTSSDWWLGVAVVTQAGSEPGGHAENLVWHCGTAIAGNAVSGTSPPAGYTTNAAVITAAALSGATDLSFIAIFEPGSGGEPCSTLLAIGPAGEERWARRIGTQPVHRIAASKTVGAGDFTAVATPRQLLLLDGRGSLLWTRDQRKTIIDIGLQSHGGPVLAVAGELLSYDRRGNLLWRKDIGDTITALDCAAGRIAAATGPTLTVFDEDGLERWSLTCAQPIAGLALGPSGASVAVSVTSGQLVVAAAPGSDAAAVGGK